MTTAASACRSRADATKSSSRRSAHGRSLPVESSSRGQEARGTPAEDLPMPQACRRRRAMRAGLGLAVVLALGFAADALVLVTTRARADAASRSRRRPTMSRRSAFAGQLAQSGSAGRLGHVVAGDDRHHPGSGRLRWNHRRRPPVPASGGGRGDAGRRSREPFAQAHGLHAASRPARLARRGRATGSTRLDQRAR